MDYGWFSHVLMWVIGLMSVGATAAAGLALFSLGRQGSRKS